jgi:hypothetical protein
MAVCALQVALNDLTVTGILGASAGLSAAQ